MRRPGAGDQGRRRSPRVPRPPDGADATQAAPLVGLVPAGVLDARLLVPAGGRVPAAAAVADLAGSPSLVRVEGDWSVLDRLDEAGRALVREFLGRVPALMVAVAHDDVTTARDCDLWTADSG